MIIYMYMYNNIIITMYIGLDTEDPHIPSLSLPPPPIHLDTSQQPAAEVRGHTETPRQPTRFRNYFQLTVLEINGTHPLPVLGIVPL